MGNQSAVIFAALIIGFLIFITLKGELSTYMGLLLLSPSGSAPATPSTSSASASSTASDLISGAVKAALLG